MTAFERQSHVDADSTGLTSQFALTCTDVRLLSIRKTHRKIGFNVSYTVGGNTSLPVLLMHDLLFLKEQI